MNKNASAMRKWVLLCGFVVCIASIALSQFPETSYDIYGMDVKTGGIFQISHDASTGEYNPSWSQDGKFIVHDVTLPAPEPQYLGITNVRTGETTPLAGGGGGNNAVWSPNGQWIAFDRCPGFAQGCAEATIYVVPAGGGTPRLVVTDAVTPHWSPNSRRIVFARPSDGSLRTVEAAGTDERLVLSTAQYGGYMHNPTWSPNGQWIAFEYYGYIMKVRVDQLGQAQGSFQIIANDYNYNYSPCWSNNSKTVVFGRYPALWSVPASGGDYTQLTTGLNWGDYDPAYSNNGQYIAFARSLAPLPKPGIAQEALVPAEVQLFQNYPNPFNPTTTIRYAVPLDANVSLAVYDMLGQKVVQVVEGPTSAGYHDVEFDASRLASGTYVYRLQVGSFVQTKRMLLLR